ncbi:hypothetical protein ES708_21546 [subsurface metagenome]
MCQPQPLYLYQRIFGGKVSLEPRKGNYHPIYMWRLGSRKAEILLRVMEPYLRVKKEEARLALCHASYRGIKSPRKAELEKAVTALKTRNQPLAPDEPNGNQL